MSKTVFFPDLRPKVCFYPWTQAVVLRASIAGDLKQGLVAATFLLGRIVTLCEWTVC